MSNLSPKPFVNVKCEPQPSTSTANEATLPLSSPCHPSPALARSVPSSQEATSPSETAGKDFVFFTTELANQAALDFEKERFDSLLEWHMKFRKRKEAQMVLDDSSSTTEKADSSLSAESAVSGDTEMRAEKRKAKGESDENEAKKPTYVDLSAQGNFSQKFEETPLRKMEMMTNSSAFSTSSSINDVVEAPTNGLCKKDERLAKLEKLGEMERQVEAERLRVEWEKEVQAHEMKKLMCSQGLSPHSSSMYPQVSGPQGAMYHPGQFVGRYPGSSAPYTMGNMPSGVYPSPYYNSTSTYPTGYPVSTHGKSQIASPAYIGDPMAFKASLPPPPGMSPHHPMYGHMMPARAPTGMPSPVPVPGYAEDPARTPFPLPGQSPSVSPFHSAGPYPGHPYAQMPYGTPSMAKGMVLSPPYPFPGAIPGGQGMPPNSGMMRGGPNDPMRWQSGAPSNYPLSFPSIPSGSAPPNPCQHMTPPKQGLAV